MKKQKKNQLENEEYKKEVQELREKIQNIEVENEKKSIINHIIIIKDLIKNIILKIIHIIIII